MSYILEALKKAQSERQLGTAPTIHTMPIPTASSERDPRDRLPLLLAGGGVVLALAAGLMWWRQGAVPAAPAAPAVLEVTQAPPPAVIVVPPAPAVVQVPVQVPVPVPVQVAAAAPAAPAAPVTPAALQPQPAPAAAPMPKPVPPARDAVAAAPEENLPFMAQLPEQVQRELPKLAFGGYMYSKNPADRLLLIDNVLRHEGQEVAPGLVLEQLQPRAAVMNYRGTRYRVAY